MRLANGLWSFKALTAAVDVELFTLLDTHPAMTSAATAGALGLTERGADALLAACTAMGLLTKEGSRYRNGTAAARHLVSGRPDYFGNWIRHVDRNSQSFDHIGQSLRADNPPSWQPEGTRAEPPSFWTALAELAAPTAQALLDAYNFAGHRRLLSVGDGSGAFTITLCRGNPHLTATVVELPALAGIAADRIHAESDLAVTAQHGDFFHCLPPGHDVILLPTTLHDWDEDHDRQLLATCFAALASGGVLLACDLFLDDDKAGPLSAALMGMNMTVNTDHGRNHSAAEVRRWLADVGFAAPQLIPLDVAGANGVLAAAKP